jgi:hypothetical protein
LALEDGRSAHETVGAYLSSLAFDPTAPTNLLHFTAFVLDLTTKTPLTAIELIHRKLFNPHRTVFLTALRRWTPITRA